MSQIDNLMSEIQQLTHNFGMIINFITIEKSSDSAIVGSSDRIKTIGKAYQNLSKRLTSKHPAKSFTIRSKDVP